MRTRAGGTGTCAVRGRRQLAAATLRRHPRLAVELAGRARPEVTGRDVDDAVGQLDRASISFSHASSRWCSAAASSGRQYENISTLSNWWTRMMPAGVLAVGAGLATEARRPAGVAQRQPERRRPRPSGRPRAAPPTCRRGRGRPPRGGRPRRRARRGSRCPPSRPACTSAGGIIGVNPADRRAIARLSSASSQQRADAGEVVEAGAGHLGAALDVDGHCGRGATSTPSTMRSMSASRMCGRALARTARPAGGDHRGGSRVFGGW